MNDKDIINMYVNKNYSTYVIAKKYDTYPNKIRRILIKNGIELNDKSTAQKKALKSGRSKHPTKGKQRSEKTKIKISNSIYNHWQDLSELEKQKRIDKAKEQWNNMTIEEKENFKNAALEAVREASKKGSKLEHFLLDKLASKGYNVLFHQKGIISDQDLEIDLLIPELKVAIEIDGPSHFLPIWGNTDKEKQKNLQRHIKADAHKTGLLIAEGFVVVRIKNLAKSMSEKNKRDIFDKILSKLKEIEANFPSKNKRYIELEVN